MKKIAYIAIAFAFGFVAFIIGRNSVTPTAQVVEKPVVGEIIPENYIPLDECIPLEDISICYTSKSEYPCFELCDVGNQLGDPNNRSYKDIMQEIWSWYYSVEESDQGVTITNEDGSTFWIEK